jgi:hypothetical protein
MMGNVQIVTPAAALISRIATPLASAKADVAAFVDELRYGRRPPTQLAFTAPICGAGSPETIGEK